MSSQPQAKRAFLDTSLAPTAPRTSRPSPRTARISRVATLRARYSGTANQCDSQAPATGTPATFKSNPISPSIPTISSPCHASITLGPGSERPYQSRVELPPQQRLVSTQDVAGAPMRTDETHQRGKLRFATGRYSDVVAHLARPSFPARLLPPPGRLRGTDSDRKRVV